MGVYPKANILLPFRFAWVNKRFQHSKTFPDDKWVTKNAFIYVYNWWGLQMSKLDNFCQTVDASKPQKFIKENADTFQKVKAELQPGLVKYRLLKAVCTIRSVAKSITTSQAYNAVSTQVKLGLAKETFPEQEIAKPLKVDTLDKGLKESLNIVNQHQIQSQQIPDVSKNITPITSTKN